MSEKTTYREAIKMAIREILNEDSKSFIMGEDVGKYGGVYAVTKGLQEEFGEERVRDTPLSESCFVGAGIGAAMGGMRPIVEIMSVNFSLLAFDQIVNNAATISHMSGGQFHVPVVIRMATGAGKQLGAQHSHSFENLYAHIAGLKVLAPATVQDAYDMLKAAVLEPDPIIIFEHVMLYNNEGNLNKDESKKSVYQSALRREGKDISLITYGGSLPKVLEACLELEKEGIDAEVLDLRSLRPLDDKGILQTIKKTHRALIIDECWKSGGVAAEIMSRIMEVAFFELDAPVTRLCTEEVPIPYAAHLEEACLPQVSKIINEVKSIVGKKGINHV